MLYVLVCVAAIVPFFALLTWLSKLLNRPTATEVLDAIEKHIQGTEGPWDWDDFTSIPIADDKLDKLRLRCLTLDHVSREEALQELKKIVADLKNNTSGEA